MTVAHLTARLAGRLPFIGPLLAERDALRAERDRLLLGWPPGHFYSPLPSLQDVRRDADRLFGPPPPTLPGIELDVDGQLALLEQLRIHYPAIPFEPEPQPGLRFHYENDYFSYGEAVVLFCLLHHLRPRRIVEVGSGYSSAAMLDALDAAPGDAACRLTFIDPYPERLRSVLRGGDLQRVDVRTARVQDVGLELFDALEAGDVLFIDSSHVSKVGSDVNYLLFDVLPRLRPGVFVHVHDIGYPFEYPPAWIYAGRAWNEAYLMRAFLQYNEAFRIRFFNAYLGRFHAERVAEALPRFADNPGTSLWLERT